MYIYIIIIIIIGKPVDVGGYYQFDEKKVNAAMRPSPTFNKILDKFYKSIE